MNEREVHYLTYDPDAIWDEMQDAYEQQGGTTLYAGDEKEMLLRSVQAVIVQTLAGVDNALRMNTLRYAVGEYLDLYGEKRGCERISAQAAKAKISIQMTATGIAKTIAKGAAVTADGIVFYELAENVKISGAAEQVMAEVVCRTAGSVGNKLRKGEDLQFSTPQPGVESVVCEKNAGGGREREDDEAYRARIRTYGLANVTTGTAEQYEKAAMSVTSELIDASAVQTSAGNVCVYLLMREGAAEESVLAEVNAKLNDPAEKPLTDIVKAEKAKEIPYTLKIKYRASSAANMQDAARSYQEWQDRTIGQAFNPDLLIAAMYRAGAERVQIEAESKYNGTKPAVYTEGVPGARLKGQIQLAVMT